MSDLIERLRESADKPYDMHDLQGRAALLREAADALEAARAEEAERDAARWRFCIEQDVMPVIANDGKTWCMFTAITGKRRSLFTGKTPAEAVDAAIAAAMAAEGRE